MAMAAFPPEPPGPPTPPSRPGRLLPLLRGSAGDPWWARPGLIAITVLAGVLTIWAIDASGYGNEYYAAAAYSGSLDWHAWLFGSFDTESFISVDKPPLSLWVTGLSVRIFGLSSWSVLLPHALAGIGTVLVVHHAVRRWRGHAAAIVAAGLLAVTPVFVVMSRYNNPDAILGLLMSGSLSMAYSAARRGSWPLLAVRTARWKYIRTFALDDSTRTVHEELYDLEEDPDEVRNLVDAPERADVRDTMRRKLERLWSRVRD